MNKRIKKKVTRRALDKYHAGEKLTHKEYELIDTYIFANEFDFETFSTAVFKVFAEISNAIADAFESMAKVFRIRESDDN